MVDLKYLRGRLETMEGTESGWPVQIMINLIDRLESAEAALSFYADTETWSYTESYRETCLEDLTDIKDQDGVTYHYAGNKAREHFKKYSAQEQE